MDKTLDNTSFEEVKKKVSDVVGFGNGDLFQCLSKASSKSQRWMKSTKALEIDGVGCIVQVTTQNRDNVAEAVCFVPGVHIASDHNGDKTLVSN